VLHGAGWVSFRCLGILFMTREKFENRLRACCCARRGAFVRLAQPTHGSKLVKHMVFILKEISIFGRWCSRFLAAAGGI
jgi:hypothetical protein